MLTSAVVFGKRGKIVGTYQRRKSMESISPFFQNCKEVNNRVKRANDTPYCCKTFKKNLRAYIDNELSGHLKAEFITHASQCSVCNAALNEMEGLIKILSNLEQAATSEDFDFSLKTRILLEREHLTNPFYRFALYFREKIRYFLAVPAFALVVFVAVFLFSGSDSSFFHSTLSRDMLSSSQTQKGEDLISVDEKKPDEIVYIYYVLETVHSTEDNSSGSTNVREEPIESPEMANTVTTVSF